MQRAVHLGLVGAVAVVLMGGKAPRETTDEQPPDPRSGANAMGEGPWVIRLTDPGPVAGRIFAVDLDRSTPKTFEEYIERKDGVWDWLGPGTTWHVSVGPALALPNCGQQGNLACQRVTVEVTKGGDVKNPQPTRPTPFVEYEQYSAVGTYNVAIDKSDGNKTCARLVLTKTGEVVTEKIYGTTAYEAPNRAGAKWIVSYDKDSQFSECKTSNNETVTGLTEIVNLTTFLQ